MKKPKPDAREDFLRSMIGRYCHCQPMCPPERFCELRDDPAAKVPPPSPPGRDRINTCIRCGEEYGGYATGAIRLCECQRPGAYPAESPPRSPPPH